MAESLEELAELWQKGVITGDEYVVRKYQFARAPVVTQVATASGAGAASVGVLKFGKLAMAVAFTGAAALGLYGAVRAGQGQGSAPVDEAEQHEHADPTGSGGPHLDGVPRVILTVDPVTVTRHSLTTRAPAQSDRCKGEAQDESQVDSGAPLACGH